MQLLTEKQKTLSPQFQEQKLAVVLELVLVERALAERGLEMQSVLS